MDGQQAEQVEAKVRAIKARMPQTYASIQAKANEIGRQAYAMVRRSVGGEANLFWACEAGHVIGTPFRSTEEIAADVARGMVIFGSSFVVIWGRDGGAH